MDIIRFEWDENKNAINKRKHAISFEEAQTVFYDDTRANLLVVCHCYRQSETVIRIISARKATKNEARQYDEWK